MIICSNCGTENLEGAYFCKKCGVAIEAIPVGTSQLDDESNLQAGSTELSEESIIFLHIHDVPDPVTIRIEDQMILGRSGNAGSENVYLNLDSYGAAEMGVSRQHAMLTRDGNQVFITDLGSTNHTFLNGERLVENTPHIVHDGDNVRLGRLDVRMFFK